MNLTSVRFGTLSFSEEQVVSFPGGILAAPEAGQFVVIDDPEYAPFQWLVSVAHPDQAISVLDPAVVLNDETDAPVQGGDTTTFVVATPGNGTIAWWLDLRHPILINTVERKGEQVTLDDISLPERFPVTIQQPHETAE